MVLTHPSYALTTDKEAVTVATRTGLTGGGGVQQMVLTGSPHSDKKVLHTYIHTISDMTDSSTY